MSDVLVLDMYWKPTGFIPWWRAAKLLWEGRAQVVKEDESGKMLRSPSFEMGMPRVIAVKNAWTKRTRTEVPCSRRNIYVRDNATCQYCGKKVGTHEYQIEHVVPRCQGGVTEWLNVVVACPKCNKRKDGRTPEQAGMPLLSKPYVPKVNDPRFDFKLHISKLRPEWKEWESWLYWNVELDR